MWNRNKRNDQRESVTDCLDDDDNIAYVIVFYSKMYE